MVWGDQQQHKVRRQVCLAVGVDDGLVVLGLMSQYDSLMEEARRGLQLTSVHTELRHTKTSVQAAVVAQSCR